MGDTKTKVCCGSFTVNFFSLCCCFSFVFCFFEEHCLKSEESVTFYLIISLYGFCTFWERTGFTFVESPRPTQSLAAAPRDVDRRAGTSVNGRVPFQRRLPLSEIPLSSRRNTLNVSTAAGLAEVTCSTPCFFSLTFHLCSLIVPEQWL